jgi:NifU-like protein
MHCSVLGREALEVAIANYHNGGKTPKKMLEGKVVCHCFGVTEQEIERVVRDNHLVTAEQVTHYCKAGGGCGNCIPDIEAIITRITEEKKKTAAEQPRRMTMLEKIQRIGDTLTREIRPMLQRDGGDIELVDVDGNRVIVSFRGMCAHCPSASVTTKEVVEAKLREFVSPDLVVEEEKP